MYDYRTALAVVRLFLGRKLTQFFELACQPVTERTFRAELFEQSFSFVERVARNFGVVKETSETTVYLIFGEQASFS